MRLSAAELSTLQTSKLSINIAPTGDADGEYRLTPGSTVGAVELGDLSVFIEPKIGIPQLLSMACYAISKFKPQDELFDYPREYALPDVLALALASAARRAFSRGLLHGYRVEEESLYTVRGRIMFAEQLRSRFGIPLPVEVRYDEFTNDVLANRLVRAAVYLLGRMRLRSQSARRQLGRIAGMLENVSPVEFRPIDVPVIRFDRLNEHYRTVVELSRLILRHGAFRVQPRGSARLGLPDGHERRLSGVRDGGAPGGARCLRLTRSRSAPSLRSMRATTCILGRTWCGGTAPSTCVRRRRKIQKHRPRTCPQRRPVSIAGVYHRTRSARRPADLREGRGGRGNVPGPPLRQTAGGGCARPFRHARRDTRARRQPGGHGQGSRYGSGTKRRRQADITNAQDLWLDYKRRKKKGSY